jgi:hypothetical protein
MPRPEGWNGFLRLPDSPPHPQHQAEGRPSVRPLADKLNLYFGYTPALIDEIKAMDGARWNPELRCWQVKNIPRNLFQLDFLAGRNPYAPYDLPLVDFESTRPLFKHQGTLARHALTVRQCIWAAEMGTGKTLAVIEVMEHAGFNDWWYVAPKSALAAVRLELRKWGCRVFPTFLTYDGLKSTLAHWPTGQAPPRGVVFDESSKVKTPQSQRSLAAKHLADNMRAAYGRDAFVILMSGSPAPKSPLDWWMQCEIACPGFLKEGNPDKFRNRLAVVVKKENTVTGGMYPHMVAWRDNPEKCRICGYTREHEYHDTEFAAAMGNSDEAHDFVRGKNEVEYLYERMKGLVVVQFKKDCLDLPEKQYEVITLEPSQSMLNAAKLIEAGAESTIQALTLLRELSDGFQYEKTQDGMESCPACHGRKIIKQWVAREGVTHEQIQDALALAKAKAVDNEQEGVEFSQDFEIVPDLFTQVDATCLHCGGKGEVPHYIRTMSVVPCPKDEVILDKLDLHEDDGRLIIYGGFTGTLDRVCEVVKKAGWEWIRVDGKGWRNSYTSVTKPEDMLLDFQDTERSLPKLCFVGHPASAGMGLTLTAACETVYYSNDFSGEARIQSEDRTHRPGTRGTKITDIIHLPSDLMVRENLRKKMELQAMSLGAFKAAMAEAEQAMTRRV